MLTCQGLVFGLELGQTHVLAYEGLCIFVAGHVILLPGALLSISAPSKHAHSKCISAKAIDFTWFQAKNMQVASITWFPFIWFWVTDRFVNPSVNPWSVFALLNCCSPSVHKPWCGAALVCLDFCCPYWCQEQPEGQLGARHGSPGRAQSQHAGYLDAQFEHV